VLQRQNLEKRIPVAETNLTAKERALLPDPNWLTEDDADAIMIMRDLKAHGGRTFSFEQVLRESGITLERSDGRIRASAVPKARARRSA